MSYKRGPYYDWGKLIKYNSETSRLRDARRKAKLTQQELADKIEVARSRIAQWETGKRYIPYDVVRQLEDILPDFS